MPGRLRKPGSYSVYLWHVSQLRCRSINRPFRGTTSMVLVVVSRDCSTTIAYAGTRKGALTRTIIQSMFHRHGIRNKQLGHSLIRYHIYMYPISPTVYLPCVYLPCRVHYAQDLQCWSTRITHHVRNIKTSTTLRSAIITPPTPLKTLTRAPPAAAVAALPAPAAQ